jgi:hypothetical protein
MAVTERQRHELFKWFEEQMGEERAATMIELMPPTGFAELATKQDLAQLEARLVGSLTSRFVTWLLASQATVVAAMAALFVAFR